jgi:hypothetical protein
MGENCVTGNMIIDSNAVAGLNAVIEAHLRTGAALITEQSTTARESRN